MACPFFYPVEKLGDATRTPRLPLGDPYNGFCYVDPLREWRPDEATMRDFCNLGYARGKCPRFPANAGPDAVRFSAVSEKDGVLSLYYVIEHDRTPLEHGSIDFSVGDSRVLTRDCGEMVRKQAQAYAASYLRRKLAPQNDAQNPNRR